MTNAEGIFSSFGDELTELSGFWTTRTTALVQAEQQHQDQSETGSGTFATTALPGTWEWRGSQTTVSGVIPRTLLSTDTTTVVVDDFIRLDSDGQFFRITAIELGSGPAGEDQVTIENPDDLTVPTGTGASSKSDPTVVTIPGSPDFLVTVAAGMRFRVLTGPNAGIDVEIASRDSGVQITLVTGFPAAFTSESWEIVIPAANTIPVESTLNFAFSGRIVLNGRVYNYTSTTATTFDGITYDDGTGTIIAGVAQDHQPITPVGDFSRTVTALDQYRSSFLVEFASGSDLDIVGTNVGVPRPAALADDNIYRELIKAVAYAPRGTIFAIEQALDVLIGPGLYSIFEDLTSASPLQNNNTVFVTSLGTTSERFVGKTYLEGHETELLFLFDDSSIELPDDLFIEFAGLHPAKEGGFREIDGSTTLTVASVDSGVTITGPPGTFSTRIIESDIFQLTDSSFRGLQGVVLSRDSDQQITLGVVQGASHVAPSDDGGLGVNFTGARWRIVRDKTNFRFYRPSAEQILEGGNVISPWDYVGAAVETTRVVPDSDGGFGFNNLLFNPNNSIAAYRKRMRVRPEDTIIIEAHFDTDSFQSSSNGDQEHNAIIFGDGNRLFMFGTLLDPVNSHINAGFFDIVSGLFFNFTAPGDFIWSDVVNTIFIPGFNTIIIEKRGTQDVRLWRKNDAAGAGFNVNNTPLELVATYPYTSFVPAVTGLPLLSYTSPTSTDLAFGVLKAGSTAQVRWRHIDYKVIPHSEFANQNVVITRGDTASPNQFTTIDSFATGTLPPAGTDVGRLVRCRDSQGANADGGNGLGEWEVSQQVGLQTLLVCGNTYNRGTFSLTNRSTMVVRDREDAFIWPRVMGHSLEILDGPNAGTYPVVGVIDPVTGKRFEDPSENPNSTGANAVSVSSSDPADGTNPLGNLGPKIVVVGEVGGVQTKVDVFLSPAATAQLGTNFDANSIKSAELVPFISGGRRSKATFEGEIQIFNTSGGLSDMILRIPPGETSAGKEILRQLKTVDGAFFDTAAAVLPGAVNTLMSPPVEHRSSTLLVDTSSHPDGQFTVTPEEVRWRLIPDFPAGDATFDVTDLLTEGGVADRYHQRDFKVWPGGYGSDPSNLELMSVFRTKVLTGQMHDTVYPNSLNDFDTQDYGLYPFYLADQFGFARRIVDALTAAGVFADFDRLFVDPTGFHIQE